MRRRPPSLTPSPSSRSTSPSPSSRGPMAKTEPKKLRWAIWHVAAKITTTGRQRTLASQDLAVGGCPGKRVPTPRPTPLHHLNPPQHHTPAAHQHMPGSRLPPPRRSHAKTATRADSPPDTRPGPVTGRHRRSRTQKIQRNRGRNSLTNSRGLDGVYDGGPVGSMGRSGGCGLG